MAILITWYLLGTQLSHHSRMRQLRIFQKLYFKILSSSSSDELHAGRTLPVSFIAVYSQLSKGHVRQELYE